MKIGNWQGKMRFFMLNVVIFWHKFVILIYYTALAIFEYYVTSKGHILLKILSQHVNICHIFGKGNWNSVRGNIREFCV